MEEQEIPNANPQPTIESVQSTLTQPPKSKKTFVIALGFILISLIIAFLAGGYFLGNSKSVEKLTAATPTTQSKSTDPTADWQMYSDTDNGYSVKIPSSWNKRASETGISFYDTDVDLTVQDPGKLQEELSKIKNSISFDIFKRPYNPPTGDVIKNGIHYIDHWKKIVLDGKEGVVYQGHQGAPDAYVIELPYKNNTTFYIKYGVSDDQVKVANQILSTFKFTNSGQAVDTISWKTYTDKNYSYSIKYPQNGKMETNSTSELKDYPGWLENILFDIPVTSDKNTFQFRIGVWDNLGQTITTVSEFQVYCKNLRNGFVVELSGIGCESGAPYKTKTVEGKTAYYISGGISSQKHEVYYLPVGKYVFEIDRTITPAWADDESNPALPISDAMLSTFKFTQ